MYYGTVSITVEAMVNAGSSAILSFELFRWIGKKANIPVSSLGASPFTREGLVHFASQTCSALSANVGQLSRC